MLPCTTDNRGFTKAHWAYSFNLPNLKYIGGCFIPHRVQNIILPKLIHVGEHFMSSSNAKKIFTPVLLTVGGYFLVGSVKEIHAARLKKVVGNMDTSSTVILQHSDILVGGEWLRAPDTIEA